MSFRAHVLFFLLISLFCSANCSNSSDSECQYSELQSWADPCDYLQTCSEDSKIPYLKLHFCALKNAKWFSFVLLTALVVFYFYLLAQLADRFFVPTLSTIATTFRLPSSVAAVTLLAFGNGAPDIFSTFAAVQTDHYQQAFGQVVGASAFITLAITGIIASSGLLESVLITRRPFLKDVGFLIIGCCIVFYVVYDYRIEVWEAWFWLCSYIFYVIVTVVGRAIFQKRKKERQKLHLRKVKDRLLQLGMKLDADHPIFKINLDGLGLFEEGEEGEEKALNKFKFINYIVGIIENNQLSEIPGVHEEETEYDFKRRVLKKVLDEMDVKFLSHVGFWKTGKTHYHEENEDNSLGIVVETEEGSIPRISPSSPNYSINEPNEEQRSLVSAVEEIPPIPDIPWYKRLAHVMEWPEKKYSILVKVPVLLVEHLTIHWAEEGKYFRPFYVLQPSLIIPVVFFLLDSLEIPLTFHDQYLGPLVVWIMPAGFLISIIVFFTTKNETPPIYEPVFLFSGLLMSMMWINATADELVSCLGCIGEILGIPTAILGFTVLAWGNSIGDLVSNYLIARKGFPEMATTAVYSSPITHVLLGLGISFVVKTLKEGEIYLTVKGGDREVDLTNSLYLNFLFVVGGLIFTLIVVPLCGFRFKRFIGIILLLVYVAGLVVVLLDITDVILPSVDLWRI